MTKFFNDPHYHGDSFAFDDVNVVNFSNSYGGFFTLNTFVIEHPCYQGGNSSKVKRELLERGDAVVVLPFDAKTQEVVLIEQFRIGAYGAGCRDQLADDEPQSPWLIECIAGMVDKGRSVIEVAHAEAKEEAGIELEHLTPIFKLFSSPGGLSERVHYFVAICDSEQAFGIHGVAGENEDIRVLRVSLTEAVKWIEAGKINNASTVIALQWLQLHRDTYLQQLGLL